MDGDGRGSGEGGQASAEYVALLAVVALALLAAVALTSGGIGRAVLTGIQRGLCAVTGDACPPPAAFRADLVPCPVERKVREERLSETIAVVRLASGGMLTEVRGSDGRVTVTLADTSAAGAELGIGAHLRIGGSGSGADARVGAGVTWTSGRSWTFPDAASAQRFIDRYGSKATIGGKLVDEARARCSILCDAIGWRPHPLLPTADETFDEGGPSASLTAAFGLGGRPGQVGGDGTVVLGRSRRRDGSSTWYVRLSAAATARLDLPGSDLVGRAAGQAVVSYVLDPHGQPVSLAVGLVGEGAGSAGARGRKQESGVGGPPAGGTAAGRAGGGASGGGASGGSASGGGGAGLFDRAAGGAVTSRMAGGAVELTATLDLTEPANRVAAADLLGVLSSPRKLASVPGKAAALGARIAEQAQVDVRTYALKTAATGVDAALSAGVTIGGAFERTSRGLSLVSALTRLPGLPFLPRDDCRTA